MPAGFVVFLFWPASSACMPNAAASRAAKRLPAGSRVEYKTYRSTLLNRELRYGLYLPPSYAASPTRKYPVLYFLHGLDENEMRWSTRGETD